MQHGSRVNREQIEAFVGHEMTNAEWLEVCELLELIERQPGADDVFDRCIERGLSVEETIQELSKLPSGSSDRHRGLGQWPKIRTR